MMAAAVYPLRKTLKIAVGGTWQDPVLQANCMAVGFGGGLLPEVVDAVGLRIAGVAWPRL